MMVSQVRGMIIYQAMLNKMSVFEYNPSEVKIAMTGYGRSTNIK